MNLMSNYGMREGNKKKKDKEKEKLTERGMPIMEKSAKVAALTPEAGLPSARLVESANLLIKTVKPKQIASKKLTIPQSLFAPPTKRDNCSVETEVMAKTTEFNNKPIEPIRTPVSYKSLPEVLP